MARTMQRVSTQKKVRGQESKAPHRSIGDNKKLTMKYIELDPDDTIDMATDPDRYEEGSLYQVSKNPHDRNEPFTFTKVKSVLADFELTPQQNAILKDILKLTGENVNQYLKGAVVGMLEADIDRYYEDPSREKLLKILHQSGYIVR